MSSTHLYRKQEVLAVTTLTATGDKATFTPSQPVNIVRWGIIADALIDVGAGMVIALDFRPTAGSNTGRVNGATSNGVDTAGGTLSVTADIAQGSGRYREINQVPGPFKVNPGEQAVFEVTDAADTAGATAFVFLEYEEEGFTGDATLPAADNRLSNMSKVLS